MEGLWMAAYLARAALGTLGIALGTPCRSTTSQELLWGLSDALKDCEGSGVEVGGIAGSGGDDFARFCVLRVLEAKGCLEIR